MEIVLMYFECVLTTLFIF